VAYQNSAIAEGLRDQWTTLFQLAARAVGTSSCSRAACHLMDILLKLKLVQYSSVLSTMESMLSSVELHGPAIFADSSASLWVTLLQLKAAENPSAASGMSERLLRWTFSRWTPSMLTMYLQMECTD
jgi:ataxia telangiectasia mutated family protein